MICKQFSGLSMEPLSVLPLGFFLFHCCVLGSVQEQGYRGPVLQLAHYICLVGASAIIISHPVPWSRFDISE